MLRPATPLQWWRVSPISAIDDKSGKYGSALYEELLGLLRTFEAKYSRFEYSCRAC
jgi:hypothetical protein